jgi:branched-chain amino acid aminotransferase
MKMIKGKIILRNNHFERLFTSLDLLEFEKQDFLQPEYIEEKITELADKNKHSALARIRLTIFRGDGSLHDIENLAPNYIIQTWEMNETNNQFNEKGLAIDIFKVARKACDVYSNVKSNNYLSYGMAALWAKKNKLDDSLLLNEYQRVADATIANVFILKNGVVKTPALTEGCVGGVMRRYLLKSMREEGMPVEESSVSVEDVLQASEVFLTNAGYGLRWVKQCERSEYGKEFAQTVHQNFIAPLY